MRRVDHQKTCEFRHNSESDSIRAEVCSSSRHTHKHLYSGSSPDLVSVTRPSQYIHEVHTILTLLMFTQDKTGHLLSGAPLMSISFSRIKMIETILTIGFHCRRVHKHIRTFIRVPADELASGANLESSVRYNK